MKWFKFNKDAKDLSENELETIFDNIQENVGKYTEQVYKTGAERYLGYIFFIQRLKNFLLRILPKMVYQCTSNDFQKIWNRAGIKWWKNLNILKTLNLK